MNLWIRAQDRKALIPINKMITITLDGIFYDGIILGTYKTKQRALEVLDEIQDILISSEYMNINEGEVMTCGSYKIYEMPKK